MLKKLSILFLLLSSFQAPAKQEVEVGGLLLDNTISRFGRDFYYQFSQLWYDIPRTQSINVALIEQVVPHAGTRLVMKMNNKVIYVTYFGRRYSPVQEKVEQATQVLIDAIAQSQYSVKNPDIAENGW
ncbi:CsgE family curli-type amyloid fiber assembly protein [Flocculibacter collagenilyticus]|uniref:CsgE family curli-type amyloid fiber assembly protein n=1 Tax=Flocculibacter collagenilyticus TaxID=2744479 RepID=UPI0018F37158|nr:CsgE family curli-type amyloid fiber assembly protein [Flocculibacter collagenilyticus]